MSTQNKVTVYGNAMCPYCGAARMLLTKKAVEFENIDVNVDPQKRVEMASWIPCSPDSPPGNNERQERLWQKNKPLRSVYQLAKST